MIEIQHDGVGPSEELLVLIEKKYSVGTFSWGRGLHTIPYHLVLCWNLHLHSDDLYSDFVAMFIFLIQIIIVEEQGLFLFLS